jgi:hypothetical protein
MGTLFKMVIAFGIGLAALKGVQNLWMTKMQEKLNEPRAAEFVGTPVTADFSKMQQAIDNQPKIDVQAAQRGWAQSQFQQMQLRNQAAEMGAPQIANGIPTMPGQGVPLQYYHPPGMR